MSAPGRAESAILFPASVCMRADLPPLSKLLYAYLRVQPDATSRDCARTLGSSVEDVIQAFDTLRTAGLGGAHA